MTFWLWLLLLIALFSCISLIIWSKQDRRYQTSQTVASAYDAWTNDKLLEVLWGEHVHLGFYGDPPKRRNFQAAKDDFVHQLVSWSRLDQLPKGAKIIDVGCGIGGSSRVLAKTYGFDVLGISISPEQIKRARQLTPQGLSCRFEVMDALNLAIPSGEFDGVWSVECGPHIPDKQRYADELLRVLRPNGILAVADWNRRDFKDGRMNHLEKIVMKQLLQQWAHPEFSSIIGFKDNLLNSRYSHGQIEIDDWTASTLPSWIDSILEGVRRPIDIINLGPTAFLKGIREAPTMLLMHWAFANGLMQFGVFRCKDPCYSKDDSVLS